MIQCCCRWCRCPHPGLGAQTEYRVDTVTVVMRIVSVSQ